MYSDRELKEFSQKLLLQVDALGASDAEVSIYSGTARQVSVREGEIEKAENATGHSVSLRVYLGKKSAATNFSFDPGADYSSDLDELVTAAKLSPEDPYCGLADPDALQAAEDVELDLYDDTLLLEIDNLQKRAFALEAAAGERDKLKVDQAECYHSKGVYYYIASNGFENARYLSSAGQGLIVIHQGETLSREYASSSKVFLSDVEPVEETGKRAADRAWEGRNPKRGPSGVFPVLFDERVSSSLVSHLLSAMNANAIARHSSWLIDYEDEIFPQSWHLIETPHRPRMATSGLYDGEGMIKREARIVECGRPNFWISNLSSARQLGIETSGHAVRSGVNTSAAVRSLKLDAPTEARDALLKSMGEGLLITGFIGSTINAHTGDYSRGANGFWVRNGEIAEAVNEITIASNLKTMLPGLRAGDDADETRAYVVPSLLVEEMTIAGA